MIDTFVICLIVVGCFGSFILGVNQNTSISSDQPIKLSYTLKCEDGKCDTTYKASTR